MFDSKTLRRWLATASRRRCHLLNGLLAGLVLLIVILVSLSTSQRVAASQDTDIVLDASLRRELSGLPSLLPQQSPRAGVARVTVVSFFASWCPPCRTEFQHLNTAARRHGSDVHIVAVNVFEQWDANDEQRLAVFLTDTAPRFHVVAGNERILQLFGGVNRIPTVFVFDARGHSIEHFIHERNAKKTNLSAHELQLAIEAALASSSP